MTRLDREEYIEQAHFFRVLRERLPESVPLQELLVQLKEEVLATTRLPIAIDFLLSELKYYGVIGTAMARLDHYFAPFQTYVIREAEDEHGRLDMRIALEILRFDAEHRANEPSPAAAFMYQFESLCRNRLRYEAGLDAMAGDPLFDAAWREWILTVRRQIGIVDFADMVYVRSQHYADLQARRSGKTEPEKPILFGEKEGKIALANRRKDPLYLFAALQRHLGYPQVPRPKPVDETPQLVPQLMRRVERLETRLKLMEDEQKGGIDLSRFYIRPDGGPPEPPEL